MSSDANILEEYKNINEILQEFNKLVEENRRKAMRGKNQKRGE